VTATGGSYTTKGFNKSIGILKTLELGNFHVSLLLSSSLERTALKVPVPLLFLQPTINLVSPVLKGQKCSRVIFLFLKLFYL
jgi:hypothetical protein